MSKNTKHKTAKIIIGAAVLLAAAGVMISLSGNNRREVYTEETAQIRDISTYYSFTGNVEPVNYADVLSDTSQKVRSVMVQEGDEVHKGDVIAVLDSTDIERNISIKEANMETSRISDSYSLASARQTYEDYKNGIENGNNSQLNSAQSSLDTAGSNLDAARKKYEDAAEEAEKGQNLSVTSAAASVENSRKDLVSAQQDYEDYLAKTKEEDYYEIKAQRDAMSDAYHDYKDKKQGQTEEKIEQARQKYEQQKETYEALCGGSQSDNTAADAEALAQAKENMEAARQEYETLLAEHKSLKEYKEIYEEKRVSYEKAKDNIDDSNDAQLAALAKSVENAQRTYDSAVRSYEDAEKNLNSTLDTSYDNYISAQRAYDEAVKNYETTRLSVEQTLSAYKTSYDKTAALSGSTADEIELKNLYDQLEKCTLYAPADGIVTELAITENGYLTASQKAAVITDLSELKIVIKIDEYDIRNVHLHDAINIYINALDKNIKGEITSISSTAETSAGVSYFTADVSFASDDEIRAGMSAEVKLVSQQAEKAVSLSAEAVQYEADNSAYVLLKEAGKELKKQPVTIGVSDGSFLEILEGVEEGDTVCYIPSMDGETAKILQNRFSENGGGTK